MLALNVKFSSYSRRSRKWRSVKTVKMSAPNGATSGFCGFDFFFQIVKGEKPLTRCGESGVQRMRGGIETPLSSSGPRSEMQLNDSRKPNHRYRREKPLIYNVPEKISACCTWLCFDGNYS